MSQPWVCSCGFTGHNNVAHGCFSAFALPESLWSLAGNRVTLLGGPRDDQQRLWDPSIDQV